MRLLFRIVGSLGLVLLLLFCGFGFLATFEPLPVSTQVTFRMVYGLLGAGSLLGLFALNRPRRG